jgi:integrase
VQRWVQEQFSTGSTAPGGKRVALPYLVLRGVGGAPYYKRRIPPALRSAVGRSTFTCRLTGPLGGRAFHASYSRAHSEAEQLLQSAGQPRRLSAHEALGVAGQWAQQAGPIGPDPTGPEEAAAILAAVQELGLVLPAPVPAGWSGAEAAEHPQLGAVVQRLAQQLESLDHPGLSGYPSEALVHSPQPAAGVALRELEATVQACRPSLNEWLQEAARQLQALGVVVPPDQVQAVALRISTTASALARQSQLIEAGSFPAPLQFPPPPAPSARQGESFGAAIERWAAIRSPAPKTRLDTEARFRELADHLGSDQLGKLTGAAVSDWRAALLAGGTAGTAKRKLALVRAVLTVAGADGLAVDPPVIERLAGRGLRDASGTRRQRRPFSLEEAAKLWQISRGQQGRPLDRWGFPLGLAIGCRLEELAGLERRDVTEIGGIPVVLIQPSEDRRLKSDSSVRKIPVPGVLAREGFVSWAMAQPDGLLFPEPPPPAADPRRSHYASVRLGKLIRGQAGIADRSAVFHSTRHFVAQQLVDSGAEQRVVEQVLGHSSRSMTARYSRDGVPLTLLKEAMERRCWGWVPAPGH